MGHDSFGQVGNGSGGVSSHTPVKIVDSGVVDVAAGDYHSIFLKTDGSVWQWGGVILGKSVMAIQ